MKVCHLTSVHIPFDTRIFHKECASLVQAGYEVHLVARQECDDIIRGIYLHGVRSRNGKLARMLFTVRDVYKKALEVDADIYHFHDPELVFAGLALKLQGKRVICDVHEDYRDYINYKESIPLILRKPAAWMTGVVEDLTFRFYDAVIAVTPTIFNRFRNLNPATIELCNYPSIEEFASRFIEAPWETRTDTVVYIGSISFDRSIREMLHALRIVRDTREVQFVLGGTFTSKALEHEIMSMPEFSLADYRGYMSRDEVGEVLSHAKVGLAVMYPNTNLINAYPTKLFEYMMAGVPVIASDFPLMRDIVRETGCGILVEPKNTQALVDAVRFLLENPEKAKTMGERGRKAVWERYNWERERVKLLNLYSSLTAR